MRRIIYFFIFLSYLNVLTLLPGSCAALMPKLDETTEVSIGENPYEDYESIWEIVLTNLLEKEDLQYQADDFPVSAHHFQQNETKKDWRVAFFEPFPNQTFSFNGLATNTTKVALFARNSKNAFAQHHDYLFRLTPF